MFNAVYVIFAEIQHMVQHLFPDIHIYIEGT